MAVNRQSFPRDRLAREAQDAARDATLDSERRIQRPFGAPTAIVISSPHQARVGDAVICDPSAGASIINLPKIVPQDHGKCIAVKNTTNGSVTVACHPYDTIDGGASDTVSGGQIYIATQHGWKTLSGSGSGGGGSSMPVHNDDEVSSTSGTWDTGIKNWRRVIPTTAEATKWRIVCSLWKVGGSGTGEVRFTIGGDTHTFSTSSLTEEIDEAEIDITASLDALLTGVMDLRVQGGATEVHQKYLDIYAVP